MWLRTFFNIKNSHYFESEVGINNYRIIVLNIERPCRKRRGPFLGAPLLYCNYWGWIIETRFTRISRRCHKDQFSEVEIKTNQPTMIDRCGIGKQHKIKKLIMIK